MWKNFFTISDSMQVSQIVLVLFLHQQRKFDSYSYKTPNLKSEDPSSSKTNIHYSNNTHFLFLPLLLFPCSSLTLFFSSVPVSLPPSFLSLCRVFLEVEKDLYARVSLRSEGNSDRRNTWKKRQLNNTVSDQSLIQWVIGKWCKTGNDAKQLRIIHKPRAGGWVFYTNLRVPDRHFHGGSSSPGTCASWPPVAAEGDLGSDAC